MTTSDINRLSEALSEAVLLGLDRLAKRKSQPLSPRALSEGAAGSYIGYSGAWMRKTRTEDEERIARGEDSIGPPYIRVGRSIHYLIEDLDAWLDLQKEGRG